MDRQQQLAQRMVEIIETASRDGWTQDVQAFHEATREEYAQELSALEAAMRQHPSMQRLMLHHGMV